MAGPRQRASSLKIPRGNPVDNELPVASHMSSCSRKEVFQPHLPVRLPCYARERIHRAMADARLLANPTSWSRVADSSPNYDRL